MSFRDPSGKDEKATFKPNGSDGIVASLPLTDSQPGPILVSIQQYGLKDPKTLSISGFAEVGKYNDFRLHAGDANGVLSGTRLDGVASVEFHSVSFSPVKLSRKGDTDSLALVAPAQAKSAGQPASALAQLKPGDDSVAQVHLKDGRTVPVPAIVQDSRPSVTLINTYVQLPPVPQPPPPVTIKLGANQEMPLNGQLTFSIKSVSPAAFSQGESVEIATADGLQSAKFSLASGGLVLQDATTAIGVLNPAKSFGASAFGPLRLRPILADGTQGDWVPLATLVRLPTLQSYICPPDQSQPCTLNGGGLYLLDSVAPTAQFQKPVTVPDGYASNTLQVPRVTNGQLYAKLRDDSAIVNTLQVPEPPAHVARRVHRKDKPESKEASPADADNSVTPGTGSDTDTDTNTATQQAPSPSSPPAAQQPAAPCSIHGCAVRQQYTCAGREAASSVEGFLRGSAFVNGAANRSSAGPAEQPIGVAVRQLL